MPLFITFEGIEGSGKTTQIKMLYDHLVSQGHAVMLTREPGGTPIGDQIRKVLLDRKNKGMTPLCELLLYAADRAQHCQEVIRPALNEEKIVLCDRFTDATTAYQEGGRQLPKDLVAEINQLATEGLKPNFTLLLDCPVEVGLARANHRILQLKDKQDRFEREEILFHERVRDRYLKLAEEDKERFVIIDATQDPLSMHAVIGKKIKSVLK
jgi:dTMP kinase